MTNEQESGDRARRSRHQRRRDEMLRLGVQSAFLLNGGGAVALLAYLAQTASTSDPLRQFIVVGLIPLAFGVAMAGAIHFFRLWTWEKWEESERLRKLSGMIYFFGFLSIACFLVGVGIIVVGAL